MTWPRRPAFELLLHEIGLLPALDIQTMTLARLQAQARYNLVAEGGLRLSLDGERASIAGAQLRSLLHYHCGVTTLRTRQMMIDLQSL